MVGRRWFLWDLPSVLSPCGTSSPSEQQNEAWLCRSSHLNLHELPDTVSACTLAISVSSESVATVLMSYIRGQFGCVGFPGALPAAGSRVLLRAQQLRTGCVPPGTDALFLEDRFRLSVTFKMISYRREGFQRGAKPELCAITPCRVCILSTFGTGK